ncbi:whirlin-like isoform X3 [Prorops nasuta]|uniref:whirlin-like isoform X3 n=1 Tax=Prorops nasuta TaxID=863751 RepID=UPI0034CE642F
MASSTEDYGSELKELQWGGGASGSHFLRGGGGSGGGGGGSHYLRSGGGASYEAEDLEAIGGGSSSRHHGLGQHHQHHQQQQHRGYYSPPGTSYTIVERPPSAPHHHSSHATPYRSHRSHGTTGSGAISPEQVLRLFGSNVSDRRHNDRRTPASSPASVAAGRSTSSSTSQQQSGNSLQNPPISPSSQPLSLQELTVRTITMTRDPLDSHHGFGICVKGGKDAAEMRSNFRLPPSPYFVPREREAQPGVGVYISRVEEGSVAERAGLRPGDTILEVNGTPFRAMTHEEALKMLKSCRTLSMTVRGPALDPRCRGGHPVWSTSGRQQSCSWMDRQGRPASPPPIYPSRDSRYCPRTRKVELSIQPGQSLGLMIRGGLEYGLGIYVTGVDKDSVADRAGLLVGDQILEVNGQSFEESTHDEAVQILKTNKRMSLLIRDVGKVPHSCTTSTPMVLPSSKYQDHDPMFLDRPPSPASYEWRHRSSSHTVSAATASMVDEKARVVLARSERAALSQLLADYRTHRITIEDLVVSLSDLLNTHEKLTMLTELRELVDAKDRAIFDDLVYNRPRLSSARRKDDRNAHSDLIVTPSIHDHPDYEDEMENARDRRHSSPGGPRTGNPRDYGHHHLHSDNLEAQLLDDGSGGSGGGGNAGGGPGGGGSGTSGSGNQQRRQQSAQKSSRNDISDRREEDGAIVVPDHQGNLRITVKKTKSILGIAIEGGANTKHPLPRIINIHDNGAAYEAGGLEVGQLILEVDGHKVEGLHHQEVARLIAESFARRDRNEIEFLVVEAKKSNLEPKPTALIFLEA